VLTNAFYYRLYRPYLVSSRDRNDITARRSRIAKTTPQEKLDQGMTIVLNKSLKNEIVNYAQNVSHGVTGFKSNVRKLITDMGSFGLNAMYNGYDSAVYNMGRNLQAVASSYNKSVEFFDSQQQSGELRSFSRELRDRIGQGQDRLSMLGLSLEETPGQAARMRFDREALQELSHIELHTAISANLQVFHSLHQSATEVLTAPLSSHIQFKGLNYHYNYQLGRMVEDGFGIIESGMIVDRIV